MAKFHFDLEGVLRQRKNAEQVAQRDVAVLQLRLVELQQQLQQLDDEVKSVAEDMRQNKLVGQIDVKLITAHRRWQIAMERKAVELAKQIAEQQARVTKSKQILTLAARDHKAIEKLREKQLAVFNAKEAKRELDLLDEAGMQIAYNHLVAERQA